MILSSHNMPAINLTIPPWWPEHCSLCTSRVSWFPRSKCSPSWIQARSLFFSFLIIMPPPSWPCPCTPAGQQAGPSNVHQPDGQQADDEGQQRPWWYLLDDFVPVEALADGRDPRCGTGCWYERRYLASCTPSHHCHCRRLGCINVPAHSLICFSRAVRQDCLVSALIFCLLSCNCEQSTYSATLPLLHLQGWRARPRALLPAVHSQRSSRSSGPSGEGWLHGSCLCSLDDLPLMTLHADLEMCHMPVVVDTIKQQLNDSLGLQQLRWRKWSSYTTYEEAIWCSCSSSASYPLLVNLLLFCRLAPPPALASLRPRVHGNPALVQGPTMAPTATTATMAGKAGVDLAGLQLVATGMMMVTTMMGMVSMRMSC
jgi:hypothetical protein